MGNKLEKVQANTERTKMCPIKGDVYIKYSDRKDIEFLLNSDSWKEAEVTIHQAKIIINSQIRVKIDKNLLIISQNQVNFDITFLVSNAESDTVYIIRCKNLRQFKDFAIAIFVSKRPSWMISPVCQCCMYQFTIVRRDHHCRNCGKNICAGCSKFEMLEMIGYIGRQRVCIECGEVVIGCMNTIMDIQMSEFKIKCTGGLYFNSEIQSVLMRSLRD